VGCGEARAERLSLTPAARCGASAEGSAGSRSADCAAEPHAFPTLKSFSFLSRERRQIGYVSRFASPHEGAVIVALLNQKGGIGNTTLALHLAAAWGRNGERVTLIDADPQGSALDWSEQRATWALPRLFGVVGLARDTCIRRHPSSRETSVTSSSKGRRASPD
jgi:AAA domain